MPHKDPEAKREYMREYYKERAEKLKQKQCEYHHANREEQNEKSRKYFQENKVVMMAQSTAWRKAHPGYHAALNHRRTVRLKEEIIDAYGGKCECCGEDAFEFLTIDHINGDGKADRQKGLMGRGLYMWLLENGCPRDRYRLLCMNCNFALGRYKRCPHNSKDKLLELVSGC